MARKPKAKRPGRPRLARGEKREQRSIRLPSALWKRIEAYGNITATIEKGMTRWLDHEHEQVDCPGPANCPICNGSPDNQTGDK